MKYNFTLLLLVLWMLVLQVRAGNNLSVKSTDQSNNQTISSIYNKIDFSLFEKLKPEVFEKAYLGYLNLKAAHKLNVGKEVISICDYSLSANTKRLWVIDLKNLKVLYNTLVAHGQGTGEEFATEFSNKENSHQSSIGFFVTGNTYLGEHGLSLYLYGLDEGFNCAAFKRSIVLHGAAYVCESFIKAHQRLGRSWGCPAVSQSLAPELISLLKEGTCLFAYYPSSQYLSTSNWLNKKPNLWDSENNGNKFELKIPQQPDGDESKQLVNR